MGSFIATGVNINVLFVQGNGCLLFTMGFMVDFLLPWYHQHVVGEPKDPKQFSRESREAENDCRGV